jgi:hypothetical protein
MVDKKVGQSVERKVEVMAVLSVVLMDMSMAGMLVVERVL